MRAHAVEQVDALIAAVGGSDLDGDELVLRLRPDLAVLHVVARRIPGAALTQHLGMSRHGRCRVAAGEQRSHAEQAQAQHHHGGQARDPTSDTAPGRRGSGVGRHPPPVGDHGRIRLFRLAGHATPDIYDFPRCTTTHLAEVLACAARSVVAGQAGVTDRCCAIDCASAARQRPQGGQRQAFRD